MNPHRDKTYYIRGKNGSSLRCFCWVSHVVGGGHCSLFRVLVVTLAFASLHTRDAAPSNSPRALTGHECDAAPQGVASPVIRNRAAEQGNMHTAARCQPKQGKTCPFPQSHKQSRNKHSPLSDQVWSSPC